MWYIQLCTYYIHSNIPVQKKACDRLQFNRRRAAQTQVIECGFPSHPICEWPTATQIKIKQSRANVRATRWYTMQMFVPVWKSLSWLRMMNKSWVSQPSFRSPGLACSCQPSMRLHQLSSVMRRCQCVATLSIFAAIAGLLDQKWYAPIYKNYTFLY